MAPLSEEQKIWRKIEIEEHQEQQRWQAEERRVERERQQAETEAVARHEAAVELAEQNRKARLERQERDRERQREREILELRLQTAQQRGWMNNVENSARNVVRRQYVQSLYGELEKMLSPEPPSPEPEHITEIVYTSEDEAGSPHLGDRDFNPKLWTKKPRPWW